MKRKLVYLLVVVMMLLSMNPINFSYASNYSESPSLVIGRNRDMQVFNAGEEVRFVIPIENAASSSAKNVIVTPTITDLKDFPFEVEKMTINRKIASIHANSNEDVAFYLKVAKNAEAKTYTINFNIEYETDTGSKQSLSEKIYVKIKNDKAQPSIKLTDLKLPGKKLLSGKTSQIKLELKNDSDLNLKDIEVKLDGFAPNNITLGDYVDTQKIRTINAGEYSEVPFKIDIDPDLKSGNHTLDLIITYKDDYDKEYKEESKLYLPIEGAEDQETDFSFENLTYPKDGVDLNKDFVISFDLKNTGEQDARAVKVSVEQGNEILPKSASIKSLGELQAGGSKNLSFTMFAKDGVESKNYPVKINIEYKMGDGDSKTTQSMNQYVGIFVKEDKSESAIPKIIADNYSFGGEYVKAGSQFPLSISFLNTNTSHAVKNVKVTLKTDGIFSPVGGSNSFFIEKIGSKERASKKVKLKAKPDAKYQTYDIVADLEYEDNKGNKYTASETIGIPVIQEMKLVIADVEKPAEVYTDTPIGISVDFYNMGRGLVRNLMVRTEGDFDIKDGSTYVGNVDAGADNYYDATITPHKEAKIEGKIIFEYDDTVGNHYTTEKVFNIEVQKQEELPPMDPMEEEMPEKSGKGKWVKIGAGILVLVGIGIFIYKKRKRKKEEVGIDE